MGCLDTTNVFGVLIIVMMLVCDFLVTLWQELGRPTYSKIQLQVQLSGMVAFIDAVPNTVPTSSNGSFDPCLKQLHKVSREGGTNEYPPNIVGPLVFIKAES
jgi:hypothetical protein